MDDLKNVVDQKYLDAYDKAVEYVGKTNKLPALDQLTLDDEETIHGLTEEYEAMDDYEKTFVASDVVSKVRRYAEKIRELKALEEETGKKTEELPGEEA